MIRALLNRLAYSFGFYLCERRLMRGIFKRYGGDFVDMEAYIGVYAITAARRIPGCRVLAFEPHPAGHNALFVASAHSEVVS